MPENINQENSRKIILDLCGGTGAWSNPYKEAGYDVRLITLPGQDVLTYQPPENVYGILAAPPCTHFSFARTHPKKSRDLSEGLETVNACLDIIWECQKLYKSQNQKTSPLKFWCLENPNGWLKFFLGKPVFEFDPYEFGDNYSKKTHLWGYFNPPKALPLFKQGDWRYSPRYNFNDWQKRHIVEATDKTHGYYAPKNFHRMSIGWYLNSSAKPNVSVKWKALRFIKAGKELTIDYEKL